MELEYISFEKLNTQEKQKHFSAVVRANQEHLYWHIRQMLLSHEDTNDVLQNTFVKAWKGVGKFRGDAKISTWLYRIATNETLSFLASKQVAERKNISDINDYLVEQLTADSYFNGDDAQWQLQKAILTLPEKQRLVFNMKYFEEMTYEEMSEIVGTSVGALKSSYHHAVKKIEKHLNEGQ